MKSIFFLFVFITLIKIAAAQTKLADSIKIYNPYANAKKDIDSVLALAKKTNKNVLIQVGGNWCVWCIRLDKFIKANKDIQRKIEMDFVSYKLNYSKENKNIDLIRKYKNPDRFGFPVLLVLNADGELLHTQDSSFLESGENYDKIKLYQFIEGWTKKAVEGAAN
jgi:thiol:disulfide interchange protein